MLPLHHIPLPTPYPVGPVNVYLIPSAPFTLIDAGPDTAEAKEELQKALAGLGLELSDIKRIVITHSHLDHSGLAGWLQSTVGAEVFLHPFELQRILSPQNFFSERLAFLKQAGLPPAAVERVIGMRDKLPAFDKKRAKALDGGEELVFADGTLRVYHFPGHAPGHLCLYDPRAGNFFSGDFLLPDITPNPLVEFDPYQPGKRLLTLKIYMDNLRNVEDLEITKVWPGHGKAFSDYRKLISHYRVHHENRLANLWETLKANGEMTVYQLTRLVYPGLEGFNVFLGLSEIQAHLDVLNDRGLVFEFLRDGVSYYRTKK